MTEKDTIRKLVLVFVSGNQATVLMSQLVSEGYDFTCIDSSGGIIQETTYCLLIGLPESRLDHLLELIGSSCQPYMKFITTQIDVQPYVIHAPLIEAQVGGAFLYVLNVSHFEQI
ncbi:MAG: cyclic-di-AMP receptor [Anaerolineales bacterium]|nr:cyclic-di-AMP receptor [Anaerolineales bacterium]